MSYLILGGTGHTGAHVVRRLREEHAEALRATRTPREPGDVRFEWLDATTHDQALATAHAIYLIAPPAQPDPFPVMAALFERALRHGVRRFVLLSSSAVPENAPGLGAVERLLRERAPEWAVLKPSWFMQNFTDTTHPHARTIAQERKLYTSTGSARVGFVDARDIADVAVCALLAERAPNASLVITGSEALSYDDVARLLNVQHVHITDAEAVSRWVRSGLPQAYAELLTHLDTMIRAGAEDRVTDTVQRMTGHRARTFTEFLLDEKREDGSSLRG